jgi:hypothetical protein
LRFHRLNFPLRGAGTVAVLLTVRAILVGWISPGSQNEKWGFHTEVTEVVMALIFWTG